MKKKNNKDIKAPKYVLQQRRWSSFTVFVLVLLQALVEVGAQLWTKHLHHLVLGHLAEDGTVDGAVRQAQAASVKLVALHVVADPLQDVVHRPELWLGVSVGLSCDTDGCRVS